MKYSEKRYLLEHQAYLDFAKPLLPYAYKVCVRLSKKPAYQGISTEDAFHKTVNTLFLTLSKQSGIHIDATIGYNGIVGTREPHFHSLVLSDRPVTENILQEHWGRFQSRDVMGRIIGKKIIAGDSRKGKGIYIEPYNRDVAGIIYCGVKHTPLATTMWCPNHRNKNASCGGSQGRFKCKIHQHLQKATT